MIKSKESLNNLFLATDIFGLHVFTQVAPQVEEEATEAIDRKDEIEQFEVENIDYETAEKKEPGEINRCYTQSHVKDARLL